MTTGERIRKRREELGLTQTDLALRMGYKSRAAICNVEKDKEDLTTTRIRKFADALETTPSYLMGWEESSDAGSGKPKIISHQVDLDNAEVKKALEIYNQIENLPKDKQDALINYLRFLRSDT